MKLMKQLKHAISFLYVYWNRTILQEYFQLQTFRGKANSHQGRSSSSTGGHRSGKLWPNIYQEVLKGETEILVFEILVQLPVQGVYFQLAYAGFRTGGLQQKDSVRFCDQSSGLKFFDGKSFFASVFSGVQAKIVPSFSRCRYRAKPLNVPNAMKLLL